MLLVGATPKSSPKDRQAYPPEPVFLVRPVTLPFRAGWVICLSCGGAISVV